MNDFFTKLKTWLCSVGNSIRKFFKKIGFAIKSFFLKLADETKSSGANKTFSTTSETSSSATASSADKTNSSSASENSSKNSAGTSKANAKPEKSSSSKSSEKSAKNKTSKSVRLFFLNFFDVLFEIAFFCGIFCILRSDFFSKEKFSWAQNFNFENLKIFAFIGIDKSSAEESLPHSQISLLIICVIFALYIFYKLIFALVNSKRFNKIVSVLLLAMNLVSLLLLRDKFLIFLIFYILMFFAFQFSCGINFKTSKAKCAIILILSFASYLILLCAFSDSFRNLIFCLYKEMHLPKSWL